MAISPTVRRYAPTALVVLAAALLVIACSSAETPTPGASGTTAGGGTRPNGSVPGEATPGTVEVRTVDDALELEEEEEGTAGTGTTTPGAPTSSTGTGTNGSSTTSTGHGRGTAPIPVFAHGKYAWTQLGPNGQTLVRALADGACPAATIDGREVAMQVFKPAAPPNFPHTTCEASVPPGSGPVTVGGHVLPGPPKKLDRIVVVGDIGCYVKATKQQDCNDPAKFPAKQVGDQIAAAHPDLVVFVGDIYYTQAECADAAKCGGVPYGDKWETWAYDFFDPYHDALDAAPWIFSRGNHESCDTKSDNGGPGWFQILAPVAQACANYTDPFLVDVLGQRFVVFDSALAQDSPADPSQLPAYEQNFRTLAQLTAGKPNVWFVDHRPVWAATKDKKGAFVLNDTLEQANRAAGDPVGTNVDLVLSGHMHSLGYYTFADGRPAQLVSGGGGTKLDKRSGKYDGMAVDGTTFSSAESKAAFGYYVFDRTGPSSWNVTATELGGTAWKTCRLVTRTLTCS